jgi:hypothetical protein
LTGLRNLPPWTMSIQPPADSVTLYTAAVAGASRAKAPA